MVRKCDLAVYNKKPPVFRCTCSYINTFVLAHYSILCYFKSFLFLVLSVHEKVNSGMFLKYKQFNETQIQYIHLQCCFYFSPHDHMTHCKLARSLPGSVESKNFSSIWSKMLIYHGQL